MFQPSIQFDFNQLFGWMTGLPMVRAKAVMNTDQGVYMFNAEDGVLSVKPLMMGDDFDSEPYSEQKLLDSRIELIDGGAMNIEGLEVELLQCRMP
jgi:hypothetical protein